MQKKKILIVDDEEYICSTLSKILSSKDYDVSTSLNSTDALENIKKKSLRFGFIRRVA